jgi:pSer/pThr/pTyr-binding forkhead associated (FHA) protein
MDLRLVVAEGVHRGTTVPITKFPFMIGRASSCNLRPASGMVSKQHCALICRDDKVYVHDFNRVNGTFVNEHQVDRRLELHDGDLLRIGPLASPFNCWPPRRPTSRRRCHRARAPRPCCCTLPGTMS